MLRGVVTTVFGIFWSIVLLLTGGRFLALLANANRDSSLVSWLYRHSDFWVKPFFGVFALTNKTVGDHGGVFEPASFIAFIVYVIAGLLIMAILNAPTGWYGNRRMAA